MRCVTPIGALCVVLGSCVSLGSGIIYAQTVRFAVIGDYGQSGAASSPAGRVAAMVSAWNPGFVVTVGDNMYGNTRTDWSALVGAHYGQFILRDPLHPERFLEQTSRVQRFFPALGNHDAEGNDITGYEEYFHLVPGGVGRLPAGSGGRGVHTRVADYYDFVRGPVHFFVLDSHHALTTPASMAAKKAWLQAGLAAERTAKWKVVVMHHPAHSSASHGSDPAMQWPFREWGVTGVLQGHDHAYERIVRDDLPYFVNGAGGAGLYGFRNPPEQGSLSRWNQSHGAMLVTADDRRMEFRFLSVDGDGQGMLRDSFVQTAVR